MIQDNAPDFSKYIGIPYAGPEDETGSGLNCWQLVEKVMREVFHMKPPIVKYTGPLDKVAPIFMAHMQSWDYVEMESRVPGDVLVLRVAGYPVHCGILISQGAFLHTLKGRNSCTEQIKSITWRRRIVGIYRWNNQPV